MHRKSAVLLVLILFTNFFIVAQNNIYSIITNNIASDKTIRKEIIKIFGKDAKKYVSKKKFLFTVDTIYNCCSKRKILDGFISKIKDNKNLIKITPDSLGSLYQNRQKNKMVDSQLRKLSSDTLSKICIHFSQPILNTIACQIYFYYDLIDYKDDNSTLITKPKCLTLLYIYDEKFNIIKRFYTILNTRDNVPVRFLEK